MTKLVAIEGIGPAYAAKLEAADIKSLEALLEVGKTAKGRQALAEKSEIDAKRILEWVNRADLARIKGVGTQYADLLEASGVDTVVELSRRRPDNLTAKMGEVNAEKNLVRRLPPLKSVTNWVEQAKALPRVVEY